MSFFNRVKKALGIKIEKPINPYEKFGISVISDEKTDVRLEAMTKFLDELKQNIDTLHTSENSDEKLRLITDLTHKINRTAHTISLPFGRAGSRSTYAQAVRGWSTIYPLMLSFISSAQVNMQNATEEQKKEVVSKLQYFFETFYLECAQMLMGFSWFEEDVTPSKALIIQSIPAPFSNYPIRQIDTASQLREILQNRPVRRPVEE